MLAEVDRLGTIAAAARELHLTAPGVSMQLAALEREVGLPLTEKHGRRIALTPAGRLLARHGRDIVDQIGVAAMEIAALREGIAGTYGVAAFPTAARSFVARAWRDLIEEPALGPALRLVELEPLDSLPALAGGDIDLAVTHSYSNVPQAAHPGIETTEIAREDVFLAIPRTGSSRRAPGAGSSSLITPPRSGSFPTANGLATRWSSGPADWPDSLPKPSRKRPTSPRNWLWSPPGLVSRSSPSWGVSRYPIRSCCVDLPSPCTDTSI